MVGHTSYITSPEEQNIAITLFRDAYDQGFRVMIDTLAGRRWGRIKDYSVHVAYDRAEYTQIFSMLTDDGQWITFCLPDVLAYRVDK